MKQRKLQQLGRFLGMSVMYQYKEVTEVLTYEDVNTELWPLLKRALSIHAQTIVQGAKATQIFELTCHMPSKLSNTQFWL